MLMRLNLLLVATVWTGKTNGEGETLTPSTWSESLSSSVWCTGTSDTNRQCRFKNLCVDVGVGRFVLLVSDASTFKGFRVDGPSSETRSHVLLQLLASPDPVLDILEYDTSENNRETVKVLEHPIFLQRTPLEKF